MIQVGITILVLSINETCSFKAPHFYPEFNINKSTSVKHVVEKEMKKITFSSEVHCLNYEHLHSA